MQKGFKAFILISLSTLLVIGCSGRTMVESDLRIKGAPDWVNEGTQTIKDRRGRLIHGIGSAPDMGDMSLQKTTADDRARAEVARIFTSMMDVVSQDYTASTRSGDQSSSEQTISREIKNYTRQNLSGVRIIAHWRDKRTGTIYALAELDMKKAKNILATATAMNADFRNYLQQNVDSAFDRIIEEKK